MRMRVVVQDLDAGERKHFGPFGLSRGPSRGWSY